MFLFEFPFLNLFDPFPFHAWSAPGRHVRTAAATFWWRPQTKGVSQNQNPRKRKKEKKKKKK
jgi:hypothetical protein